MDDLEYIKKFSKINITKACKKVKVNRGNLLNNKNYNPCFEDFVGKF